MNVLTIVSPGLKVLFERVGKPEVINRPEVLRLSGTAAVIACNHIGWVDSLWVAYAVYPRQLRYMSKQELFNSRVAKWILEQGGSFAVDREVPSRDSIKTALDLLKNGEILLIFPSGTRSDQNISFKRGAAMVALHAGVPLVPAFYQGPNDVRIAHFVQRPRVRVTFGTPIPTAGLPLGKQTTTALTRQLQAVIGELRLIATAERSDA
jgi:1-acyl-sn-glycerol-3-phosphate acyltransferase